MTGQQQSVPENKTVNHRANPEQHTEETADESDSSTTLSASGTHTAAEFVFDNVTTTPDEETSTDTDTDTDTPTQEDTESVSNWSITAVNDLRSDSRRPDTNTTHSRTQTTHDSEKTTSLVDTMCQDCSEGVIEPSETHTELICSDCGAIADETLFPQDANWKRQSASKHIQTKSVTSNTDSGLEMGEPSLGGTIDWKDMDGYGTPLSSKKRALLHRLRMHDKHSSVRDSTESTYKHGLGEINRIAADISVPQHVSEYASELLQDAIDHGLLTGTSVEAISTTVLYIACIEKKLNRPLEQIVDVSRADTLTVFTLCKSLPEHLECHDYGTPKTAYLSLLADKLYIHDSQIRNTARSILNGVVTHDVVEHSDILAHTAAAVYSASIQHGSPKSVATIADVADINTEKLQQCYQYQIEAATMG